MSPGCVFRRTAMAPARLMLASEARPGTSDCSLKPQAVGALANPHENLAETECAAAGHAAAGAVAKAAARTSDIGRLQHGRRKRGATHRVDRIRTDRGAR